MGVSTPRLILDPACSWLGVTIAYKRRTYRLSL